MNETSFNNVLTLIAPAGGLDDAIVACATEALKGLGAEAAPPDWLSAAEACDIPFQGPAAKDAEKAVRDALEGAPVDLAAGPLTGPAQKASYRRHGFHHHHVRDS